MGTLQLCHMSVDASVSSPMLTQKARETAGPPGEAQWPSSCLGQTHGWLLIQPVLGEWAVPTYLVTTHLNGYWQTEDKKSLKLWALQKRKEGISTLSSAYRVPGAMLAALIDAISLENHKHIQTAMRKIQNTMHNTTHCVFWILP